MIISHFTPPVFIIFRSSGKNEGREDGAEGERKRER